MSKASSVSTQKQSQNKHAPRKKQPQKKHAPTKKAPRRKTSTAKKPSPWVKNDAILLTLLATYGPHWTKIAQCIPGTTPTAVRNRVQRLEQVMPSRRNVKSSYQGKTTHICRTCGKPRRGHSWAHCKPPSAASSDANIVSQFAWALTYNEHGDHTASDSFDVPSTEEARSAIFESSSATRECFTLPASANPTPALRYYMPRAIRDEFCNIFEAANNHPSADDKERMCNISNMSRKQVNNWISNRRRRM